MSIAATATVSGNRSGLKRRLLHRSPARALEILRAARRTGLRILDPLDCAARAINNQRRLPPFHLRREVGDPSIFERSGAEFLAYMRLICGLRPDERVLDIGCGCGLMALFLEDYLDAMGSYTGLDIQEEAIDWCRKSIGSRRPNFRFAHLNRHNRRYNLSGRRGPLRLPFDDGSFDFMVVKSVFTHLLRDDVEEYVREIGRTLAPGGRCLASWFLFDPGGAPGRGCSFTHGDSECRYESEQSPETAVAYSESYVRSTLAAHGLRVQGPVYRGRWAGEPDGLSTQDLTVIVHADA
jgi:SAM-dependent methyltransferase